MEVGQLIEILKQVNYSEERSSFPICGVGEEHRYIRIACVVFVVIPDLVNQILLFFKLDVDVVVRIVDADFLTPEDH